MKDFVDPEASDPKGTAPKLLLEEARNVRGILVADDQDFFRESLGEALRRGLDNVAVYTIPNGSQAAEVFAAEKIDLVITDLQMPEIDGVSLLMELKEAGFGGPVVVLSGHLSRELQELVLELGALAVVEKPVDLAEVVTLCATALETPDHGIRGLSASGVAQLLALERKTGMLRVSNAEGKGDLFFRDGRLVWALAGNLDGEDAAMEILLWDDVELEILDIVPTFSDEIQRSLQGLLLDSAHARDERRREMNPGESGRVEEELDIREAISAVSLPPPESQVRASVVTGALQELIELDGAVEAALIQLEDGKVIEWENAAVIEAGHNREGEATARIVCSAIVAAGALSPDSQIDELSVVLGNQHHSIQAVRSVAHVQRFLYLVLDESLADLSLAHRLLGEVEARLSVD